MKTIMKTTLGTFLCNKDICDIENHKKRKLYICTYIAAQIENCKSKEISIFEMKEKEIRGNRSCRLIYFYEKAIHVCI